MIEVLHQLETSQGIDTPQIATPWAPSSIRRLASIETEFTAINVTAQTTDGQSLSRFIVCSRLSALPCSARTQAVSSAGPRQRIGPESFPASMKKVDVYSAIAFLRRSQHGVIADERAIPVPVKLSQVTGVLVDQPTGNR